VTDVESILAEAREHRSGPAPGKQQHPSTATELVELADSAYTFGVSTTGRPYAVPVDGPRVAQLLRGHGSLRADLARRYHQATGRVAGGQALSDALCVLEGNAQQADPVELHLRVARWQDGLVVDLGAPDGQVVHIGPAGWQVLDTTPGPLFRRTAASQPLPEPHRPGNLGALRRLLNVADDDWPLLAAVLVSFLLPDIPRPVLALTGEQGTAKSSATRLLVQLVDPSAAPTRSPPANVRDWATVASGSYVVGLDNLSGLQPWLSDAMCRAVTGDGIVTRRLYTDDDMTVLAFRRAIVVNGIDLGRLRGDIADRMVMLELARVDPRHRLDDAELAAAWQAVHPKAFAGLLDLTGRVLAELPSVQLHERPRMADFARVLAAVDQVLGTHALTAYLGQARRLAGDILDDDPVSTALGTSIRSGWQGTAAELHELLTPVDRPKEWPATARALGSHLRRLAPALRSTGWQVDEPAGRTGHARRLLWSLAPPADTDTQDEEHPAPSVAPAAPVAPAADLHEHSPGPRQTVRSDGSLRTPQRVAAEEGATPRTPDAAHRLGQCAAPETATDAAPGQVTGSPASDAAHAAHATRPAKPLFAHDLGAALGALDAAGIGWTEVMTRAQASRPMELPPGRTPMEASSQ